MKCRLGGGEGRGGKGRGKGRMRGRKGERTMGEGMGERRGEDEGEEREGEIEKQNKGRWRQETERELKPSVSQYLKLNCKFATPFYNPNESSRLIAQDPLTLYMALHIVMTTK